MSDAARVGSAEEGPTVTDLIGESRAIAAGGRAFDFMGSLAAVGRRRD